MTTPEKSASLEQPTDSIRLIGNMDRVMIGVRMHMTDFDVEPDSIAPSDEGHNLYIQPEPLVLSSGRVINKRYSGTGISKETTADILADSGISSTDTSPTELKRHNVLTRPVVRNTALVMAVGLVAAACTSILTSNGSEETLPPLSEKTAVSTSVAETTTTTIETNSIICVVNDLGQIVVVEGQNLILISEACSVTLAQLMEWNGLTDANAIKAGQTLTVTPPTTTTTIPQVIIPAEIIPIESVPVETVPVEVVPPVTELAPPETTPPTTAVPTPSNDVFLSKELCSQYGGSPHPFELGETLTEYLITLGLTRDQAYKVSGSEELMIKFMLDKVTASTKGLPGAECVPLWPAMKHIFA